MNRNYKLDIYGKWGVWTTFLQIIKLPTHFIPSGLTFPKMYKITNQHFVGSSSAFKSTLILSIISFSWFDMWYRKLVKHSVFCILYPWTLMARLFCFSNLGICVIGGWKVSSIRFQVVSIWVFCYLISLVSCMIKCSVYCMKQAFAIFTLYTERGYCFFAGYWLWQRNIWQVFQRFILSYIQVKWKTLVNL